MKNRRILTHPELEPKQIRGIDPFSDFDSDVYNRLTKICHRTDQPDVIVDGLDVVENCSSNTEYLSQELINYDKFEYYDNCQRVMDSVGGQAVYTKDLQLYVIDGDIQEVKRGSAEQDLCDNECLDLERFFNTDITKTFVISFSVSQGTAKNLFITIGNSVLDLKYLDGAYDEKTNRYTVFLDVNFKDISRKLTFKIGAYIDTKDYRNFYSHDEVNGVSFFTLSDISCKLLIRDRSNEIPFYAEDSWNFNHTRCVKKLRVTEGTAVKDNVVLNSLKSVNLGNSVVTLDLCDSKSWIHNNPYTVHDFYNGRSEIFDIKTNVYGNNNLETVSATIDKDSHLKVTVHNKKSNTVKIVDPNDFNNVTANYVTFTKTGETDEYVTFQTAAKWIADDFCSNTLIVSYNNHVLTKIDTILTSQQCPQVTFNVSKKDIEKYQIQSFNDIKVALSDAVVKVSENSKHVLWGYVVCYYSYFKNPNPNPCYIGLIREDEYLKDGFTEDYLVLAKVRFIDPHTIDLIKYESNRNNYEKLTSRNVNYIVNFDYDDIWYSKNPVTVTDAINYCQVLRNNVTKRFKLKHNYQQPLSTTYRLLNSDAKIDVKGRISVDLQTDSRESLNHLQRRIAPNTRKLVVTNVFDDTLGITPTEYTFNWDILRSKWITSDQKWAITDDFGLFGLFNESSNTIYTKYFGFNSVGPYKFINPRTGEVVIELDWEYSSLKWAVVPEEVSKYDTSDDNDFLLSYYPKEHKSQDGKYIDDLAHEPVNSKHNHFSYMVFRKQYLSKKYLVKMLDLLPKNPEYLIDGRILKCIDGHIQSSIHELSLDLVDKNLINAEVFDDGHDIIKSTTYWLSTNNFKTKGSERSKMEPKKFQDNQLLMSDDNGERKEIQSNNYVIDDLNRGFILISTTDNNGVIHITSSSSKISSDMTNNNIVIGRVFTDPDYQMLDTCKYYISTTNKRTISDKNKFLQDRQLILANKDNNSRTALESSNVIIDEPLQNNHIVISEEDEQHVIHLKSSKTQIDNTLQNGSLVITNKVEENNQVVATQPYDISTKNPRTGGSEDKPLQDGQILTVFDDTVENRKSIQSSNIVIDVNSPTDLAGHPFVKITKTDSNGVIHFTNSDKMIDELMYDLCYSPSNIRIISGKVHITIDCKKKFRITTSEILKAIQNDSAYRSIFNYELDSRNTKLFTLVVNVDTANTDSDEIDRSISDDGNFKTLSNYYESQLLFINDINLSEISRHIVTEIERTHVVTEGDESKCLVCENNEKYRFRSHIEVEYRSVNGNENSTNQIQWVDEFGGYDTNIEEYTYDPERPHIVGDGEDVEYVFGTDDLDYATEVVVDCECDDVDDFEYETDDIELEAVEEVTIPKGYKTEDVSNVGEIEDVDDIQFDASNVDHDAVGDISVSEFETASISVAEFETADAEYGGDATEVYENADEVDIDKSTDAIEIGKAENISLYRPHSAKNLIFDLSTFLSMYPMFLRYDKWAKLLSSEHGYGEARGPVNQFFAQTKSCITFKLVKSKTETVENVIPGITFNNNSPEETIYASSSSFNLEL